jgi:hypothetical protein
MNPIRRIRRIASVLATLAAALVAVGVTPAFARPVPITGTEFRPSVQVPVPVPVRTVTRTLIVGGMPGWQIALIAAGAALLAATVAVLTYRSSGARGPAAAAV